MCVLIIIMADSEDYYAILGVARDADESQIKRYVTAVHP